MTPDYRALERAHRKSWAAFLAAWAVHVEVTARQNPTPENCELCAKWFYWYNAGAERARFLAAEGDTPSIWPDGGTSTPRGVAAME